MKDFLHVVYLTGGSDILFNSIMASQQKDVARPEIELTSPFQKSTKVKLLDRLATN